MWKWSKLIPAIFQRGMAGPSSIPLTRFHGQLVAAFVFGVATVAGDTRVFQAMAGDEFI